MINWLLKQVFYFKYFILKQSKDLLKDACNHYTYSFYSESFTDGQWKSKLPWWDVQKWNTTDYNTYGIFSQLFGKFYFKAKLEPYLIRQPYFSDVWSAIWLTEIGEEFYYEIDAELFRDHFGYTVHWNHKGGQSGPNYHVVRSNFYSRSLCRSLQKDFHLFLIDWSKDWIKFSINGILCAKFRNEIHIPMQIIISHCEMSKVIVRK